MGIKILHLLEGVGGGAETHALTLLRLLPKDRIHPTVAFFLGGPSGEVAKEKGIDFLYVKARRRLDPTLIFRLGQLLKKERFNVIHSHTLGGHFYGRMAAIMARTCSVVNTYHAFFFDNLTGTAAELSTTERLRCLVERCSHVFSDQFIAVSEELKKKLVDFGIPGEKIKVIENGIILPRMVRKSIREKYIRERHQIGRNDIVVGTTGRLVGIKNHAFLLRAAKTVLNAVRNVKFLLVGDGPMRCSLENQARELCISENVIFAGWHNNVDEYLRVMDIFVLCSYSESCGLANLEAMAMCKPVIGTAVRGIRDVIRHGHTGLLVPPNDLNAMVRALLALIQDDEMAKKMGKAARAEVKKNFQAQKMADRTAALYECLLEEPLRGNEPWICSGVGL